MAKARKISVNQPSIQLDLTRDEAVILKDILNKVNHSVPSRKRQAAWAISTALFEVGISVPESESSVRGRLSIEGDY